MYNIFVKYCTQSDEADDLRKGRGNMFKSEVAKRIISFSNDTPDFSVTSWGVEFISRIFLEP